MRKIFLILLIIILSAKVFSQRDTIIYYSNTSKILKKTDTYFMYHTNMEKIMTYNEKAHCYKKLIVKDVNNYELDEFNKNDNNKWEYPLIYDIRKLNDSTYLIKKRSSKQLEENTIVRLASLSDKGYIIKDYSNKILLSTGFSSLIFPLVKEVKWTYYYPETGKKAEEEIYKDNQALSNKNWNENGVEGLSDIFDAVDIPPYFIDGKDALLDFINKNYVNPQSARGLGSKKVYVSFIVMGNGIINDVKVVNSVFPSIDKEAIRVVNLMNKKWKPGINNGAIVNVRCVLPITLLNY